MGDENNENTSILEPIDIGDETLEPIQITKKEEGVEQVTEVVEEIPEETPKEQTKELTKEKPTVESTKQPEQVQKPTRRDYSIFDPKDVNFLRGIHNNDFNAAKERLQYFYGLEKQQKELEAKYKELESKQAKPQLTYDHPEAYTLAPEYRQSVARYDQLEENIRFLQQNLVKCRKGESWQYIEGWNEQGEPMIKTVEKGNDLQAEAIARSIRQGELEQRELQNKVVQLRATYGEQYKSTIGQAQERFNAYVAKLPTELQPSKEVVDKVYAQLPEGLRALPTSDLAAKCIAIAEAALKQLKEVKTKINIADKNKLDDKSNPKVTKIAGDIGGGSRIRQFIDSPDEL